MNSAEIRLLRAQIQDAAGSVEERIDGHRWISVSVNRLEPVLDELERLSDLDVELTIAKRDLEQFAQYRAAVRNFIKFAGMAGMVEIGEPGEATPGQRADEYEEMVERKYGVRWPALRTGDDYGSFRCSGCGELDPEMAAMCVREKCPREHEGFTEVRWFKPL